MTIGNNQLLWKLCNKLICDLKSCCLSYRTQNEFSAMRQHTKQQDNILNCWHIPGILWLPSVTVGVLKVSICERRAVKRLSFACADDLVTHMMMHITNILSRSTSATGPTVTGIMSCKLKPPVDVYVSVPTVKFKFVPIKT